VHHHDALAIAAERPDEGYDPAHEGPSQEQIEDEHTAEIGLVVRQDRRQKIQRYRREKQ